MEVPKCPKCGSAVNVERFDDEFKSVPPRELFRLACACGKCDTPWKDSAMAAYGYLERRFPGTFGEPSAKSAFASDVGEDDPGFACPICGEPKPIVKTMQWHDSSLFSVECGCGMSAGTWSESVDGAFAEWRAESEMVGGESMVIERSGKELMRDMAARGVWRTAKGGEVPLPCMSERHISNCIRFLNEHSPDGYELMVSAFEDELDRRGRPKPMGDRERMSRMADICRDLFMHYKRHASPMQAKSYERMLREAGVEID